MKRLNPTLVLRLAMIALIVAMVGQRFLTTDLAKGALMGVAIGLQLLAVVMMRRQRPGSCGATGS